MFVSNDDVNDDCLDMIHNHIDHAGEASVSGSDKKILENNQQIWPSPSYFLVQILSSQPHLSPGSTTGQW